MSQVRPLYKFYPSLLDKFNSYINIEAELSRPWNNDKSPADVEREIEEGLLNTINRIPSESEAAEKGTAFNNLIDELITGKREITSVLVPVRGGGQAEMTTVSHKSRSGKDYTFDFPTAIVREFAEYFRGATPQILCKGILETKYGPVELYGYLDELYQDVVYDIKTTSRYEFPKFHRGWQKHLYPYCLVQMGAQVSAFEYTITDFRSTFREWYDFHLETSTLLLRGHCECLIEFLEARRHLITDKKIFNEE